MPRLWGELTPFPALPTSQIETHPAASNGVGPRMSLVHNKLAPELSRRGYGMLIALPRHRRLTQ